jgi:multiple sugar transport system ATP-binding protein
MMRRSPLAAPTGRFPNDIRLDHVVKRFGKVLALDELTLHVTAGEMLVVVGPSGCGKTTMLRIIAGLETPDTGDVYIGSQWANELPPGKRNLQMIFQSLALWPHMKVLDERGDTNISYPLRVNKWSIEAIANRVREVTHRVGLDRSLFNRKPDDLSGGQRQRVALARALTTAPAIYLMDEPLTSLDPPARVKMREEIKRIHQELGATTLFVTHNMTDAFAMADRIAMMRDGKIVQIGTPQQLKDSPADNFVREFLESA